MSRRTRTPGHIYVLAHSSVDDVAKVGRTVDLARRLREHNGASATVGLWRYERTFAVRDVRAAERLALAALAPYRVPGRREQFALPPGAAARRVALALGRIPRPRFVPGHWLGWAAAVALLWALLRS